VTALLIIMFMALLFACGIVDAWRQWPWPIIKKWLANHTGVKIRCPKCKRKSRYVLDKMFYRWYEYKCPYCDALVMRTMASKIEITEGEGE